MGFTYTSAGNGKRAQWTFEYTGAELAPRALAKAAALLEEERGLERALVACRAGEAYAGRKEDIAKFKDRLREKGKQRECCEVLARELARAGTRKFDLDHHDIVFFHMDEGVSQGAKGALD